MEGKQQVQEADDKDGAQVGDCQVWAGRVEAIEERRPF